MVKSMTGFGRATFKHRQDTVVTIEIKTVNSRYLDILSKIPRTLQPLELEIKQVLKDNFYRGRIELYISVLGDALNEKKLHINWALTDQFVDEIRAMQKKYNLDQAIPLSVLTSHDEFFDVFEETHTEQSLYDAILQAVQKACTEVNTTRSEEAELLLEDMSMRLQKIHHLLEYIVSHHETEHAHYRERIKQRITEQIDKFHQLDESYFIQEIAMLAEKGHIQEELTRINSHLQHFQATLNENDDIGRKLDFIIQELNREINTLGAKSIDPAISEKTIQIKSELEKIKEQIQNVE